MRSRLALAATGVLAAFPALAADQAVIVLDASGFMWGQIQGKSKIEMARETLKSVLRSVPDDRVLGLIAYGHRRKGDCDDIELLVPPESKSGAEIVAADEEGREVACLAESTGGMYLPASDADQLGSALTQTVAAATEPKPEPQAATAPAASLSAPDTVEQAATFTVAWEGPGDLYDRLEIYDPSARNGTGKVVRSATIVHGDMDKKEVRIAAPAKLGPFELRYWDGRNRRVIAVRPVEVIQTRVSLSAPASVEIGRPIDIEWQGPGERYDTVQLFDPSAMHGEGDVLHDKRLRNDDYENRKVTLPAPAEPGDYELRYWNGENRTVLAMQPIKVLAAELALDSPGSVEAGRSIVVRWVGPAGQHDSVQLFDPSARNREGEVLREKRLRNDDFDNRKVTLAAPARPGTYELRYWNEDNKTVLLSRSIEVQAGEVILNAPETIGQASAIKIDWVGPGAQYDAVQLFDPSARNGEGALIREKRLRNDDFDNRRVSLSAPAKTGTYELRYWNGENKAVLATRSINVVETRVAISAPAKVAARELFVVDWAGPGAIYDEVQIVDSGGKSFGGRRLRHAQFGERKATLKAPKEPGRYELRYWNGENNEVLATRPIIVE